ncbi:solute carrier organic anion transporter family member 4C1 [Hydra vulgaris]|uniref:solute carrier organic anion transporter family member 4C1 n=1 Tax=Hydra vulgaris TaxID=6087 RepID=UPI0032EA4D0F
MLHNFLPLNNERVEMHDDDTLNVGTHHITLLPQSSGSVDSYSVSANQTQYSNLCNVSYVKNSYNGSTELFTRPISSPTPQMYSPYTSNLHLDHTLTCGWNKFKPQKLQKLNNAKWFLFFLAVFSISQGMIINGFTNVGLSTLEKQFKFSSKQSGMIVAAKECSSLLLIAFLSFYGSFGNKPKYLGYGAMVTAFGCLLYVLPHSLTGKHIPDNVSVVLSQELCAADSNFKRTDSEVKCEVKNSSEGYYWFIFILSKLLVGAGTAPLFTLGAAYIDENVKPKVVPIYLGVWYVSTSFGPGLGFLAGGSLLNVYVDLIQPAGIHLNPEDPRWIGAWWIGHLFGGILIFISSWALLAYPQSMPGAKEIRAQAIRDGSIRPEDKKLQGKLADMIPATMNLLKNSTFMFNTLALTCGTIIATGLGPFVVKYLQAQFGVSTMHAGVASGITLIPGTAGGIFIGSYLMRQFHGKDTCEGASRYCFFFQVIAVLSVASFLIPGCRSPIVAGVHKPYFNQSTLNLISDCNHQCKCSDLSYNPVCGVDNLTYFSPCHMGCLKILEDESKYSECSCINQTSTERLVVNTSGEIDQLPTQIMAYVGECDRGCKNMVPFLCGIVLMLVLNFVNAVPNKMVVMRCVPDNERAYALGVQWIFLTLLGAIPGPLLFGIFIDKSCNMWETNCSKAGNCILYDNVTLSYQLTLGIFILQVLAAVFYFLSWKTIKPPSLENRPFKDSEECCVNPSNISIDNSKIILNSSAKKDYIPKISLLHAT